ncbi:SulP family sulfate permease [Marinilabilia salmonicolor]|jgi:SulP family sulfate permease|uniref:SulP family inorganic anion transporter n=1 Tax=Marinilabilia salmonicolor TaxID=989 RepID=UPI000D0549D6|nr:SulP family inorganic anion transporter [Marinilabilia salmonicolor]PRZ01798.1 SulP family sulfate permease [Marinilabilia salmonicolor]
MSKYIGKIKRGDIYGGLVAAIVSIPIALTFGVASGAGPEAGLYGAVIIGLVATLAGGSKTLISEPTGPMAVFMTAVFASNVTEYGLHQGMIYSFTVVFFAGVFQILLGYFKLGRYFRLMPYSVISGFMSGIALILIVMQLPAFLGHDAVKGGIVGLAKNIPELLQSVNYPELLIGGSALLILLIYPKRWQGRFPSQLAVLLFFSLLVFLIPGLGEIRLIGAFDLGWPNFNLPLMPLDHNWSSVFLDAFLLALLGSIDTILTALIADSLTREEHNSNRELMGQGLANLFAGLLGTLPGAGATMGTVVNIRTGARSRWSGIMRSAFLVILIFGAAPLIQYIPLALLAAIAFKVGIDILDWSFIKRAHKISQGALFIMYGVLLVTIFVDLVIAVGLGIFVANMLTIEKLSHLQSFNLRMISDSVDTAPLSDEEKEIFDTIRDKVYLFYLSGPMIFGVARAIQRERKNIAPCNHLILDLQDVTHLDTTVLLAIENMVDEALDFGKSVYLVPGRHFIEKRLRKLKLHQKVGEENIFHDRLSALQYVEQLANGG